MSKISLESLKVDAFNLLRENWVMLFSLEFLSYIIKQALAYTGSIFNLRLISTLCSISSIVINALIFTLIFLVINDAYHSRQTTLNENLLLACKKLIRVIIGHAFLLIRVLISMIVVMLLIVTPIIIFKFAINIDFVIQIIGYSILVIVSVKYGMLHCVLVFEETKKCLKRSKSIFKLDPKPIIAINLPIFIIGFSPLLIDSAFKSVGFLTEVIKLVTAIISPPYAVLLFLLYIKLCEIQLETNHDLNIL